MKIQKLPLTEKQQDVLDALKSYRADNGFSPTIAELRTILQSRKKEWKEKSLGAVASALKGTYLKGYISGFKSNKKSRNLEII